MFAGKHQHSPKVKSIIFFFISRLFYNLIISIAPVVYAILQIIHKNYLSRPLYETYIIFFLSILFYCQIGRVPSALQVIHQVAHRHR